MRDEPVFLRDVQVNLGVVLGDVAAVEVKGIYGIGIQVFAGIEDTVDCPLVFSHANGGSSFQGSVLQLSPVGLGRL